MIKVHQLTHHYGIRPILCDINFQIEKGELVVLLGPLLGFLLGVSVAWTGANMICGMSTYVYAFFLVPLACLVAGSPAIVFAFCPLLMAIIAWLGVKQSLKTFPWPILCEPAQTTPSKIGWPFSELHVTPAEYPMPLGVSLFFSLVSGTLAWCFLEAGPPVEDQTDVNAVCVLAIFPLLLGVLLYIKRYTPVICENLCMGKRRATNRWIIPQHDVILLTPLLMILSLAILPFLLRYLLGFSLSLAMGLVTSIIVVLGMRMGPRTTDLYYTGVHSKFGDLSPSNKEFTTPDGSTS